LEEDVKNLYRKLSSFTISYILLFFVIAAGSSNAQLITNGGFESSSVGTVDSTDVSGWLIQVASGVSPAPVFEIVSDTVEQGNRALKVTVHGLGTNTYDIQVVADSIPVTNGTTYNYSVWAKAEKAGAQVNFTVGNYAYSEYKAIRPANLTTQWKQYTMQFTVNDNQTYIRAPIHFSYAGDTSNAIYIDNLKIVDANLVKRPVIVQAESGMLGSNFSVMQDGNISYVTAKSNYTGLTSPGDTSRMITYHVTLPDEGYYNLFAHIRVGPNGFDDDSFFYGKGFGAKDDTASADWVFINGLATAGFSDSTDYVDGPGTLGNQVWKWVNITKNSYQGTPGDSFYVSIDSLTRTFQIGSREDGLDIDEFAFGKSNLYYTVGDLNNDLPGSATISTPDTGTIWTGPAFATGMTKFIGSAYQPNVEPNFSNYWTQVTPENAGKWGSVAASSDTTQWNWGGLDATYNFAENNHLVFKDHNLIWGNQQPSWISSLDSAQQIKYIETWIRMVGQRYPKTDMIDVVNEPLHNPPDGNSGHANYMNALGGRGATGWDWVIKAYQLARKYLPNAKLLINDYSIINDNSATTSYLQVINLLKDRGLIDGIGVQAHRFSLENADTTTVKNNLAKLGATGLPVYVSELDLGNLGDAGTPDDNQQLQLYKKYFPILWRSPAVKGITIWGYIQGLTWNNTTYLVRSDGTARPALLWLAQYVKDNPITGIKETASNIPSKYELDQNYPNPFNPSTNIRYSITKASKVTLKIYDILGREVQTLVNRVQAPGRYTITFNAQNLASGVYFYQINAGNFTATKKLMLLK
jgi:endo-1,4-beta-xylanase